MPLIEGGVKRLWPTLANSILTDPILANPILANLFLAILVLARPIWAKTKFWPILVNPIGQYLKLVLLSVVVCCWVVVVCCWFGLSPPHAGSLLRGPRSAGPPKISLFFPITCLSGLTLKRVLEVSASGLPLHHGAQLAVDITLRSALTAAGLPSPSVAHVNGHVNGTALARARRQGEKVRWVVRRCHLVVVGVKTGSRDGVRKRATSWLPLLQADVLRRWMRMLAISCGKAFAASLLSSPEGAWTGTEGRTPDLADLFAEPWGFLSVLCVTRWSHVWSYSSWFFQQMFFQSCHEKIKLRFVYFSCWWLSSSQTWWHLSWTHKLQWLNWR